MTRSARRSASDTASAMTRELVGKLAHACDLDAQGRQGARQVTAVGVAGLADEQFGADREQFGGGDGSVFRELTSLQSLAAAMDRSAPRLRPARAMPQPNARGHAVDDSTSGVLSLWH